MRNRVPGIGRTVLIVDQSDDNRDVLGTALRRRGIRTLEASEVEQGLQMAHDHHPGVIVLDLGNDPEDDENIQSKFDAESDRQNSTLVMIGIAKRLNSNSSKCTTIAKPYHYAPLIRTIEQLASR